MTLQIGLLLALACALATNTAFLCKHRGAVAAARVDIRRPLLSAAGAMIGFGTLLLLSHKMGRIGAESGLLLGAAAGTLFGVSDVAIKALVGTVPADVLSIVSPWTAAALVASIAAFYASARALQVAAPIAVIALTSVAANVSAILGGVIVFGDPIGGDAEEVVARGAAFALVIGAAALMPGPRQTKRQPEVAVGTLA